MISAIKKVMRKDAFPAVASTAIRSAGRLIATMLLARFAGVETFAAITLSLAVEAIIIGSLNAMCVSPAAILAPGRRRSTREAVHSVAEEYQTIAAVSCFGIGSLLLAMGVAQVAVFLPFILAMSASAVLQARRSTRIAEFRSRSLVWVESFLATTGIAAACTVVHLPDAAFELYWTSQAIAQLVILLGLPGVQEKSTDRRLQRIVRASICQTGVKVLSGSVATTLSSRSQLLVLSALVGPFAVAGWGAIGVFGAPIRMGSGILRGITLPRLASRSRSSMSSSRVWQPPWLLITCVIVPMLFVVADMASPYIVSVVFGSRFAEMAWLAPFIVTQSVLAGIGSFMSAQLQVEGRSGWVSTVRWVIGALSVPSLAAGAFIGELHGFAVVGLLIEATGVGALLGLMALSKDAFWSCRTQRRCLKVA